MMKKNLTSFNSKTGKAAALKRWQKDRVNLEADLIVYASEKAGHEVTFEEAIRRTINYPSFEASEAGKVAAQKFLTQRLGLLPQAEDTGTVTLQAEVIQIANVYDRDTLGDVVEYAPDHAARLLETANWNGAEEWRNYVEEKLNVDAELE